jgi:hypothetical protein
MGELGGFLRGRLLGTSFIRDHSKSQRRDSERDRPFRHGVCLRVRPNSDERAITRVHALSAGPLSTRRHRRRHW